MSDRNAILLAELAEFRQSLALAPPRATRWIAFVLVAFCGVGALWAALTRVDLVVRATGRLRPATAPQQVKSKHGGRVVEVLVREGQTVKRGDPLCRLDADRLDAEIRKRQLSVTAGERDVTRYADLAKQLAKQHRVEVEAIEAKTREARDAYDNERRRRDVEIVRARQELATRERDHEREVKLAKQRASSQTDVDRAASALAEAQARLRSAEIPLEATKETVLVHEMRFAKESHLAKLEEHELRAAARRTEVETARREIEALSQERAEAFVTAPIDGVITAGEPKVGELLDAGAVLFEVAPAKGYLFEAVVRTGDVANLKPGMPARVSLDAFDRNRFGAATGKVTFVSTDAVAAADSAGYRMQVAIESAGLGVDPTDLRLGMAGAVDVVVERDSLLSLFFRQVRKTISFG